MGLSGVYDFTVTANDIITDALEHLGVKFPQDPLDNDNVASMLRSLRFMIKAWQAEGIGLWLNQQVAIFPQKSGQSVLLGPSGGNATAKSGMVTARLTVTQVATDTTVTLDNVTGLSDGMFIGIQLDSGTMQWTTISGAPAGQVVTISDALTSAATTGNIVYAYTTKMQRPKSVIEMRRVDYVSETEIPLLPVSRDEYMSLPTKSSVGPPNQWYYDPQLTNGELFIWPTVDTVQTRLVGTVRTPIQDFATTANDAQFPDEWAEALSYNVALRGGTKFDVPDAKWNRIVNMAAVTKSALEGFDSEDTGTFFQVARRW